jgi:hypothetical protein
MPLKGTRRNAEKLSSFVLVEELFHLINSY